MDKYIVKIVNTESGKIDLTMKDMTRRFAEKVKRGAEINLDHENYHVEIDKQEEDDEDQHPMRSEADQRYRDDYPDPPLFDDNADQEEDDNV